MKKKRSIHQKDTEILNVYVPKDKAPKYMSPKWTKLKGNIQNHEYRCRCQHSPFSN